MHEVTDNELVSFYLDGDEQALEALIERYVKIVYGFVYRYVNDASSADDITQEVFIRSWRNLKKFDRKKNFKTWLFAIAKNASLDALKKRKAIPFSMFDDIEGNNVIIDTMTDEALLPNELFERKEIAMILALSLEKLSPKYRMTLFLRYNDHFSFNEIAETLGESLDTIKSRHRRGLILLKNLLMKKSHE